MMRRVVAAALCWMVASAAAAADFDFQAPATPGDVNTPAVMRDLAERLLPVYQDADSDRYLTNLSALQMVAGSYSAADVSRQSLRDRRRGADAGRPVGRAVIYDIYAYAKAIQADNRVRFADSFATAYREVVSRLSDADANAVDAWLTESPTAYRDALQASLARLRGKDSIGEADAIQLVWSYVRYAAFRDFAPLVGPLVAEDERRRYAVEAEVTITTVHGVQISAWVVRPTMPAKPLPSLLEFDLDDSRGYAKECAAHGYVGVVADARRVRKSFGKVDPYRFDGEDARAVIDWIAAQPWSDGRVGMYGTGYGGFMAWAAARRAPPALKAIATTAPTAPGVDFPMSGNIFRNSAFRWLLSANNANPSDTANYPDSANPSGTDAGDASWRALDQKWYVSGRPYRDLGAIYGKRNPIFIRWLNHPSYDRYWQTLIPYKNQFAAIDIPVLTETGFYAASEPGALYYFTQHLRYNPHADHTLVIGPYGDGELQRGPSLRGFSPDPVAVVNLRELRYQWFDHVFKGQATVAPLKGRVNYEVMGANEWRNAPSLEALGKTSRRFYLDPVVAGGVRGLTQRRPAGGGFAELTMSFLDRSDAAWRPVNDVVVKDPTVRNGLMFLSGPLAKSMDVSGLFTGLFDFTVNKLDLDLAISLYERLASGEYVRLFGPAWEFRASYVRDRAHRHLLKAGEREQLTFTSERMTSRRLRAGSRLALVLGIDKRADRELNYGTGGDVSAESIADGKTPLKVRWYAGSYIELPVGPAPDTSLIPGK
jgi:putative CocE/NonD family hydrolase